MSCVLGAAHHHGVQLPGAEDCQVAGLAGAHGLPVPGAAQEGGTADETARSYLYRLLLPILALTLCQQTTLHMQSCYEKC